MQGSQNGISNNPEGRPTGYRPAFNRQAKQLCLLGATDKDLADFFEVDETTINTWKKKHPAFQKAIKSGKQIADAAVAEKLYTRATGFKYTETTFEKAGSKESLEITTEGDITSNEEYVKKVVTKQMPPDTSAAIFWLKNRQKENWRDKHEVEQTNKTITVKVDGEEDADE